LPDTPDDEVIAHLTEVKGWALDGTDVSHVSLRRPERFAHRRFRNPDGDPKILSKRKIEASRDGKDRETVVALPDVCLLVFIESLDTKTLDETLQRYANGVLNSVDGI